MIFNYYLFRNGASLTCLAECTLEEKGQALGSPASKNSISFHPSLTFHKKKILSCNSVGKKEMHYSKQTSHNSHFKQLEGR